MVSKGYILFAGGRGKSDMTTVLCVASTLLFGATFFDHQLV